ncbi:hypothetical protein BurJ1DRAFT_3079 [Burkholderiales bacterium JOSHI_001]|nr:hypothetical protein BurJ1DRAFT_3079 [Burkholderiales bacterium JOSHI_001]
MSRPFWLWALLLGLAGLAWWVSAGDAPEAKPAPLNSGSFPWSRTPEVLQYPTMQESKPSAAGPAAADGMAPANPATADAGIARDVAALNPPVRDRNDPTEALVGVVPQPVPMDRRTRDRNRAAAATGAGAAAAPDWVDLQVDGGQVQYRDRQGRVGRAQLGEGAVSEADLGLAFYPGGQLQAAESRRIQDPLAGESATVTLVSADPLANVAAFYRSRWSTLGSGVVLQEDGGVEASAWTLTATWPDGRGQSVTLLKDEGTTRVVLLRTRPAVAGRP